MEAHERQFGPAWYFDGFYCAEDYGWKAKPEIFMEIKRHFEGDFLVIGDRFHDMEVARVHHLKAIGCGYGYGSEEEFSGASVIAGAPEELIGLILRECPLDFPAYGRP